MKFVIEVIHSSCDCDEHNRALIPPVYQNNTFALCETSEQVPYRYSHLSSPTRRVLKDTTADLERGAADFAFSSDMAGIDVVWRTFPHPGDTIAVVANTYDGAHNLLAGVYEEWGVNVVFADLGNPDRSDELLAAHNVKLTWLEAPPDSLLRLAGIKAFAAKIHTVGALVGIDNTFATPYLQQPLEMDCDIVFHSAAKYLCGYSDILMGTITVKTKELAKPLHDMMVRTGAIAGPMDCWLVLHGIEMLVLRMEAHCRNAFDIAHCLEAHPAVEKVFYPGLSSHERYELVKTRMPRGIGGVVMVYLKNDTHEAANSVIKNMKLVEMVFNLGGAEGLVNHYYSQSYSGVPHDMKMEVGIKVSLLHFSTGAEGADDIWSDIPKALDSTL